jgi:hypothetical protein
MMLASLYMFILVEIEVFMLVVDQLNLLIHFMHKETRSASFLIWPQNTMSGVKPLFFREKNETRIEI